MVSLGPVTQPYSLRKIFGGIKLSGLVSNLFINTYFYFVLMKLRQIQADNTLPILLSFWLIVCSYVDLFVLCLSSLDLTMAFFGGLVYAFLSVGRSMLFENEQIHPSSPHVPPRPSKALCANPLGYSRDVAVVVHQYSSTIRYVN
uniref:Uncharacterized protein n=1 Tax=Megaselia scalaris TaxID=36166 RepID=T1GAU0_MEGSC